MLFQEGAVSSTSSSSVTTASYTSATAPNSPLVKKRKSWLCAEGMNLREVCRDEANASLIKERV